MTAHTGDIKPPLVSVVLPAYRESTAALGLAIDSILVQTLTDLELIVVLDDPSNEGKLAYLQERVASDHRVRVLVNHMNVGPWASYARGIREARGTFVAVQDSDDESAPTRLARQVAYLDQHPEIGVVGTGLTYVEASTGRVLLNRQYPANACRAVRRYSPLAHPTSLRRVGLDARFGSYDLDARIRHAADYDLWCRWAAAGVGMASIPDLLYRYMQSDSNFKAVHTKAILRDTVRIKRRYAKRLHFGPIDRLVLAVEVLATMLPARVVVGAFYLAHRGRSLRRLRGPTVRDASPLSDTRSGAYASRLSASGRGWRRLGVQEPYRWNIRRLRPGLVLDIGCGVGRNLAHLDGHGVGVDHNEHAVAEARRRGLRAFTPEEFSTSPWGRPGTFDSMLVAHVLEHLHPPEALRLMREYLPYVRPGGRVIVIVPQEAGFASDPSHIRYLDADAVGDLLESLGLVVDRRLSFPFPAQAGRLFRHNETMVVGRTPGGRPASPQSV